jgi:hypothetical protein
LLEACERRVITREELCSNLLDQFVGCGIRVGTGVWDAGLGCLPTAVAVELLGYARLHPEPRVFLPRSLDPRERMREEERAVAVQRALMVRLAGGEG